MEKDKRITQYKSLVAESFGSLSIGIFGVSLVGDIQWATTLLIIIGVIIGLCGIYVLLPYNLNQEWFLKEVAGPRNMAIFKRFGWFIVVVMFGYSLTQTGVIWMIGIGLLSVFLSYVVFYISLWRFMDKRKKGLTSG